MMIRLQTFTPAGVATGEGPIVDVLSLEYGDDLDAIGMFSFEVPADSPSAAAFVDRGIVQIYVEGEGYVFQGRINNKKVNVQPDGTKILQISGQSVAVELTDDDLGQGYTLESETLEVALDDVLTGTGWTTGTIQSYSLSTWSRRFDGVRHFTGVQKIIETFGAHFRLDSRIREIESGDFQANSGITFRNFEGDLPFRFHEENLDTFAIANIEANVDSQRVINVVEPLGQRRGISGDMVTLEYATDTTDYTTQTDVKNGLDFWYLEDAASVATYGRSKATIRVSDIFPLDETIASEEPAANSLHGVAANYLKDRIEPLRTYNVFPIGLKHIVNGQDLFKLGDLIAVKYLGHSTGADGILEYLDIDENLIAMGYRRRLTSEGNDQWAIRLANIPREVPTSASIISDFIQQFETQLSAPWPTITWGGIPPAGRLTPGGMQLSAPDTLTYTSSRSIQFTSDDFQTVYAFIQAFLNFSGGSQSGMQMKMPEFSSPYAHFWDRGFSQHTTGYFSGDVVQSPNGSTFAGAPHLWYALGNGSIKGALTRKTTSPERWVFEVYDDGVLKEVGKSSVKGVNQYVVPPTHEGLSVLGNGTDYPTGWTTMNIVDPGITETSTGSTGAQTGSGTSHLVGAPQFVNTDDFMIIIAAFSGNPSVTTPSGWTLAATKTNGSAVKCVVFYKYATSSSEGSITITTGSSVRGALLSFYIPKETMNGISFSTGVTGTSTSPNCDACSAEGILRGFIITAWDSTTTISGVPNGWADWQAAQQGSGAVGLYLSVGPPQSGGATGDPAAHALNASANWLTFMMAITYGGFVDGDSIITAVFTESTSDYARLQIASAAYGGGFTELGEFHIPGNTLDHVQQLTVGIPIPDGHTIYARAKGTTGRFNVALTIQPEDDLV